VDDDEVCESLRLLTGNEIREMSQSGLVEIGSHTHGHEILTQISKEEAKQTIIQSIEFITRHTGKAVRAFSYPNGNYNDSIKEILNINKIQYAFTTINGAWNACSDHLEIPRVAIGGYDNKLRFIFHLNGFTAKLSHLKRACSIR